MDSNFSWPLEFIHNIWTFLFLGLFIFLIICNWFVNPKDKQK